MGGGPDSIDQPITKDLSYSLTGRRSNGVWDVRPVDILMVVETSRLPEVIDELTRENCTVLDVSLTPVDSFAALAEGCYYGSAPVSDVAVRLETRVVPFLASGPVQSNCCGLDRRVRCWSWGSSLLVDAYRFAEGVGYSCHRPMGDQGDGWWNGGSRIGGLAASGEVHHEDQRDHSRRTLHREGDSRVGRGFCGCICSHAAPF